MSGETADSEKPSGTCRIWCHPRAGISIAFRRFCVKSSLYDITTSNRASTRQTTCGQFTSPSLNCYGCNCALTDFRSMRDNYRYRASFSRQNHHMETCPWPPPSAPTSCPASPHPCRPCARRRPGRGRRLGVGPVRQHPLRLRRSVAHLHRLVSLPAEPLTVARYLAARANAGASIATLRLATSAISKTHEWAKLESPCRDPGVRASLKGWVGVLQNPSARPAPSPPTCWL